VAAGIALSRVYRGRHYPSDVLAGAAIGYASARLVLHFRERVLDLDAGRLCRGKKTGPPPAPPSLPVPADVPAGPND
jgi:membrane-associated phospholipid phosphatase